MRNKLFKYPAILIVISLFLFLTDCKKSSEKDLLDYASVVDPMIGTGWHGHTFPGPAMPFGLVQLSPDTRTSTWDGCSGYHYSDKSIIGFSHTHYSGTGAGGGGDIMFMPTIGEVKLNAGDTENSKTGYRSVFSHDKESASPGYYSVVLDDYNVKVELTATKRAGFHRYTFPETDEANVILDLVHGLHDGPDSLFIRVDGDEITGYRAASGGLDKSNTIYYAARFSKPFNSYGLTVNDSVRQGASMVKGRNVKAFFRFKTKENEPVLLKVGISVVDIEGAKKNLKAEIPDWNFDKIKNIAKNEWNKELNRICVEGGTPDQRKIFYTALYHAHIHPNIYMDVDGRYRSIDKKIYRSEDFENYTTFSLWDTFRALHPLFTIIDQKKTNQFIRTFIERYKNGGHMPIMEFSNSETFTMIGYHSVPVLVDAYVKGIRDYDVKMAYKAVKQLTDGPREGKDDYLKYGFLPDNFYIESVSRTLEYSYDDWCASRIAKDFNEKDFERFSQRGEFYKNVFRKDIGFMSPKNSDYKWLKDFDPMLVTKLHYTEANAYQYTTFVPQDVQGLIKLMGGDEKFVKWVDNVFHTATDHDKILDVDVTGLIGQYAHGNEPSHHVSYLYNFAGMPWKTQERVREIMDSQYHATPEGISGNDDAGQMSAWYVFSAMGFYPVTPGMDYYVMGSPVFDKVTINLENGKSFVISVKNNSEENKYIRSVKLNGKKYLKSYLKHLDIMNGSVLEITMGNKPGEKFGIAEKNRPYSIEYNCAPVPEVMTDKRKFIKNTEVTLACPDHKSIIRYTTDGSEPDERSSVYSKPVVLNRTCVLKVKCFKKDLLPGYTVAFDFEKLKLQPSVIIADPKPGLKYVYKEVGVARTSGLDRYPADRMGVIKTFNVDSIKDDRPFGYIYDGFIYAPVDGRYVFYLESNDGAVLYLDNKLIIDNDGDHMLQTLFAEVGLKKGYHPVKLKYFQMGGGKKLLVSWETPLSGKVKEITEKVLFHK